MTFLVQFGAQLRAIDPRLPYLLTAAVVGSIIWLWRTLSPSTFEQVPTRVRALPAAAVGAILTAGATESLNTVLIDLVFGAFAGVTAVGGHETLRRLMSGEGQTPAPLFSPEQLAELAKQLASPTNVIAATRPAPVVMQLPRAPSGAEAAPPALTIVSLAETARPLTSAEILASPPVAPADAGDPANESYK